MAKLALPEVIISNMITVLKAAVDFAAQLPLGIRVMKGIQSILIHFFIGIDVFTIHMLV